MSDFKYEIVVWGFVMEILGFIMAPILDPLAHTIYIPCLSDSGPVTNIESLKHEVCPSIQPISIQKLFTVLREYRNKWVAQKHTLHPVVTAQVTELGYSIPHPVPGTPFQTVATILSYEDRGNVFFKCN